MGALYALRPAVAPAHVTELPSSHASPLARPRAIAELIEAAAHGQ